MIQPALINLSRRASFGSSNIKTEMQRIISLLKVKLQEQAKETGEDATETNAKIEAITALILEQANLEDIESEQKLTKEELAALKVANKARYNNLRKEIRKAAEKFLGESIQSIELTDEVLKKASANFWKSPNGDYANLDLEDIIVQYKVLSEYKNLDDVGEFVFQGSNLLDLLRHYPNEHWRLLNAWEEINDKIGNFGEDTLLAEKLKPIIKEAQEKLKGAGNKAIDRYVKSTLIERGTSYEEEKMKTRFQTFNNLSGLRNVNFIKTAENWPFSNTNLLALPHFK